MRGFRLCSVLFLSLMFTGCVSLGKYNDRVAQINNLNGEMAALEKILQKSETERRTLDQELAKARENLASLEKEHVALVSQTFATSATGGDLSAMDARKQEFADEMTALAVRLADADTRIRELTMALAATEDAAKKVPLLEAALAEREQQVTELTNHLRKMEIQIAQVRNEAADLSLKRNGSEEKSAAVAAILASLGDEINKGEISVQELPDKLIVTMKEQVLFASGSARITKSGQKTLSRMSKVLKKIKNNQIVVEGHTDNMPIRKNNPGKYRTNWDLAAARAANVLKHLENKGKVNSKLLALAGYSCNLPAAANDCTTNRRLNRRIEIALVPMEMDRLAAARNKTALKK